jgi:hypothetical protein
MKLHWLIADSQNIFYQLARLRFGAPKVYLQLLMLPRIFPASLTTIILQVETLHPEEYINNTIISQAGKR